MILTKLGRPIASDTFTDITTSVVTQVKWVDGGLSVIFAPALTTAEQQLVRLRAMSADDGSETLLRQAQGAYQANVDYLAIPVLTQAQVGAQVAALTRQVQALIRLVAPTEGV